MLVTRNVSAAKPGNLPRCGAVTYDVFSVFRSSRMYRVKIRSILTILPLMVLAGIYIVFDFSYNILIMNLSRNNFAAIVRKCGVACKSVYTLISLKPHVRWNPGCNTTLN